MIQVIDLIIIWMSIVILFLLSLKERILSFQLKKQFIFIFILFFSIFFSYRELGLDLNNYKDIYTNTSLYNIINMLSNNNLLENMYEPIFLVWLYISKSFSLSFNNALFIYTIIPQIIIYKVIVKNNKENLLTVYFIYMIMCIFQFDLTRHFFAAAFVVLITIEKSRLKKILYGGIAICSHFSSMVICFLIEPIRKWMNNKKIIMIVIIGIIIMFILNYTVENNPNLLNYRIFFKFKYYFQDNYIYKNIIHKILFILINVIPTITTTYLYRKFKHKFKDECTNNILYSIKIGIALSIICFLLGAFQMGNRVMLLMNFPSFLLYSKVIFSGKLTKNAIIIYSNYLIYDFFMTLYYIFTALNWLT